MFKKCIIEKKKNDLVHNFWCFHLKKKVFHIFKETIRLRIHYRKAKNMASIHLYHQRLQLGFKGFNLLLNRKKSICLVKKHLNHFFTQMFRRKIFSKFKGLLNLNYCLDDRLLDDKHKPQQSLSNDRLSLSQYFQTLSGLYSYHRKKFNDKINLESKLIFHNYDKVFMPLMISKQKLQKIMPQDHLRFLNKKSTFKSDKYILEKDSSSQDHIFFHGKWEPKRHFFMLWSIFHHYQVKKRNLNTIALFFYYSRISKHAFLWWKKFVKFHPQKNDKKNSNKFIENQGITEYNSTDPALESSKRNHYCSTQHQYSSMNPVDSIDEKLEISINRTHIENDTHMPSKGVNYLSLKKNIIQLVTIMRVYHLFHQTFMLNLKKMTKNSLTIITSLNLNWMIY